MSKDNSSSSLTDQNHPHLSSSFLQPFHETTSINSDFKGVANKITHHDYENAEAALNQVKEKINRLPFTGCQLYRAYYFYFLSACKNDFKLKWVYSKLASEFFIASTNYKMAAQVEFERGKLALANHWDVNAFYAFSRGIRFFTEETKEQILRYRLLAFTALMSGHGKRQTAYVAAQKAYLLCQKFNLDDCDQLEIRLILGISYGIKHDLSQAKSYLDHKFFDEVYALSLDKQKELKRNNYDPLSFLFSKSQLNKVFPEWFINVDTEVRNRDQLTF